MDDKLTEDSIRRQQIETLVESYYYNVPELQTRDLDELKKKTLELYFDTSLSLVEINNKLLEHVEGMILRVARRTDTSEVAKNHKEIYSKLEELGRRLEEAGVDYLLAGSLCGYIKYGEESKRTHDDIDISLNEKDMDKFEKICTEMGLNFHDDRLTTSRVLKNGILSGEHEVLADTNESDFHIGAFCFERLADGSVVAKGYYHDDEGLPCVKRDVYNPELANELYGGEIIEFNGVKLKITSPERIYQLKNYTRNEKDMMDIEFLEPRIDKDKLQRMNDLSKNGHLSFTSRESSVPVTDMVSSDNNELSSMLNDSKQSTANENVNNSNKENKNTQGKVFKKVNPNNNGFTSLGVVLMDIGLLTLIGSIAMTIFGMLK